MSYFVRQRDTRLSTLKDAAPVSPSERSRRAWVTRHALYGARGAPVRGAGRPQAQAPAQAAQQQKELPLGSVSLTAAQQRVKEGAVRERKISQYKKELTDMGVKTSGAWGPCTPAELAKAWEKSVPGGVTPKEMVKTFLGTDKIVGFDANQPAYARIKMDGNGDMHFAASRVMMRGVKVDSLGRDFQFGEKSVYHAILEVNAADRGKGGAREMFRDAIPMYDKMGLKRINTSPGLQTGAYTWARYGFEMHNGESMLLGSVKTRLDSITSAHKFQNVSGDTAVELHNLKMIVSRMTPTARVNQAISDLRTPRLDALWGTELGKDYPGIVKGNSKPTMAKALLANMSYSATLSLAKNSPNRKRLDAYIDAK